MHDGQHCYTVYIHKYNARYQCNQVTDTGDDFYGRQLPALACQKCKGNKKCQSNEGNYDMYGHFCNLKHKQRHSCQKNQHRENNILFHKNYLLNMSFTLSNSFMLINISSLFNLSSKLFFSFIF